MSKSMGTIDTGQGSLIDHLCRLQSERESRREDPEGRLNVQGVLRAALCGALKRCPLSRWEVAGKMSHFLGLEITKYMIDAWTAESKEGHRFPAEYLPAFCAATGDSGPLEVLGTAAGMFVLPGPDALRAEIRKIDEQVAELKREKARATAILRSGN